MKRPGWTREPLLHFLAAGALIFAFFAWRGEDADPASRVIEVDRKQQAQIAYGFERMMSRAPTDAELDTQIERFVREEILYREALRLGLDRDDPVVRRRLAQKMDMLASARAETEQPTEAQLRAWYKTHAQRFSDEPRYTLDQVWFTSEGAARTAQPRLGAGENWRALGGQISLPQSIAGAARGEVLARFGEQFLEAIDGLEPGDGWQGPVASGFGWHLVRLRKREKGHLLPFAEVAKRVEDDWRGETMATRREAAYRLLRDAYRVGIDK